MSNMLEIQELSKYFGNVCAVDAISFELNRGQILGFLGPNGAGKSTTMKMLSGFLAPTQGRIMLDGVNIQDKPLLAKARMGYLPEGAPLYSDMTPLQFLSFVADIRGLKGAKKQARIEKMAALMHLENVIHAPIDTLSKGFKRRVGLAQALLHEPDILILDEPSDGLDPNQKHEARQLIRAIATHTAILLSTHILEEVTALCTHCIIINQGKIVNNSTPAALLSQSPTQRFEDIFRDLTGKSPRVASPI
jgi:ABC-2 type transport system ATP-binding protein